MKNLQKWLFAGFCFTVLSGTLLHFAYEWSGKNIFWAMFSGVNESTWEHMKLFFFPSFVFAVVQSIFLEDKYPNFWCVKFAGMISGLLSIPIIFYTYNGSFGKSPDWFNISIFVIAAAISCFVEYSLFKSNLHCPNPDYPLLMFFILMILFIILTFCPPDLPLFIDPRTNTRGIT